MKMLITIAGTLLAGATPFAASAALGHEAATTQNTAEAVNLRRAVQAAEPRSQADELVELRRAIAELRAEKERLHAELMVERVSGELRPSNLHMEALKALQEHDAAETTQPGTDLWVEAVDEFARGQYVEARKQAAEAELRKAEEGLILELEAVEAQKGQLFGLGARLNEADRTRIELERVVERPNGPWVTEAPSQNPRIYEVQLDDDESGRWRIVTERGSDEGVEVLLKQLEAEPSERAPKRKARRFVVDGKTLEIDADSFPEGVHERHVVIQGDFDRLFGVLSVDPEEAPHEVQIEENLWVDVDGNTHRVRLAPQADQRRAFIRDFQDGDVEKRVRSSRKVFVQGADGELIELDVSSPSPGAPPAPRAPDSASAPPAPRVSLGFSGTPPQAPAPRRDAVRWFDSGTAPRDEASRPASNDRDEMLREVHVLTKEMLAELRLLRAAVDELRRDVDSRHDTRPRTGSGTR